MKEYRVEIHTYPPSLLSSGASLAESSLEPTQQALDIYAAQGWRLVSTNVVTSGTLCVYLFFERDL